MSRAILAGLMVSLAAAIGYFLWAYEVDQHYENGRLVGVTIRPRSGRLDAATDGPRDERPPARAVRPTFRIATFNLDRLDEHKLGNPRALDVLLRIVPQFEIVAVQGVQGPTEAPLVRLLESINAEAGRSYAFAACPPLDRESNEPFSAFLYDQTAVEIDRTTVHLVGAPPGRLRHRPLVGAFRARGPKPEDAFTFTLVNVHVDAERAADEIDLLADVFRAVRDDGRNEDDIILLGDFAADEQHLGRLGQVPHLLAAVTALPTTVRGTRRVDNLLFDRRATGEFTARSGAIDLMRQYELTLEAAQEVSDHLPVWAEFSSFEGGAASRVADAGTRRE